MNGLFEADVALANKHPDLQLGGVHEGSTMNVKYCKDNSSNTLQIDQKNWGVIGGGGGC